MNIIKRGILGTAVALTVGIATMGSAFANTSASSYLRIENFHLLRGDGTVFSAADFTTLTGTNDAHATAVLNSTFANASDSVPIPGPGPSLARQCVGAPCSAIFPVAENDFTTKPPATGWVGTFGYADQDLTGSLLDAGGANARTRADAATNANMNIASGNSDVGTSTTFQFRLAADTSMTFDFDATAFTDAVVSAGSSPTANANARLSWSINIVDLSTGTVVYTLSPSELNALSLRSATDANPGTGPYNFSGSFTETAAGLSAGTTYQLTLQHNTLANVLQEEVPEPATLAIIAAGLLSMSLVSRRRKS